MSEKEVALFFNFKGGLLQAKLSELGHFRRFHADLMITIGPSIVRAAPVLTNRGLGLDLTQRR